MFAIGSYITLQPRLGPCKNNKKPNDKVRCSKLQNTWQILPENDAPKFAQLWKTQGSVWYLFPSTPQAVSPNHQQLIAAPRTVTQFLQVAWCHGLGQPARILWHNAGIPRGNGAGFILLQDNNQKKKLFIGSNKDPAMHCMNRCQRKHCDGNEKDNIFASPFEL